ncbi:MAG: hypothetical protein PVH18_05525 [Chloroflexota bacterium]
MPARELTLADHLTQGDLVELTRVEGDAWRLSHVRRLLKLIELIGQGLAYDETAMTIAVCLHDWGGYSRFKEPGVEHALRSRQVAESMILPRMELPGSSAPVIMEAIEYHDYRDLRPVTSTEALLLREADFLDFLGIIGLVREYGRGPADLVSAYQKILARREFIRDRFTLPQARELASVRLERLEQCLIWLQEESFDFII